MLAQHDLSPYLTKAKNNTISTLVLHREEGEGGRAQRGVEGREKDGGMRGRLSEKTAITGGERGQRRRTEGEQRCREEKKTSH